MEMGRMVMEALGRSDQLQGKHGRGGGGRWGRKGGHFGLKTLFGGGGEIMELMKRNFPVG